MKTKAFTLIEVLVTIVILGLLITILFRTYHTLVDISVKVENEKSLQQEMLYLSQAMQSLADRYTVDYDRYDESLINQYGIVDQLHLIDDAGQQVTLAPSGECYDGSIGSEGHLQSLRNMDQPCQLVIDQNGQQTALPAPQLVRLSHLGFKITPYVSNSQLVYSGDTLGINADQRYDLIQYPGFRLFARMYAKTYDGSRPTNTASIIHDYYSTTASLSL